MQKKTEILKKETTGLKTICGNSEVCGHQRAQRRILTRKERREMDGGCGRRVPKGTEESEFNEEPGPGTSQS